jgi:hypothetical protein
MDGQQEILLAYSLLTNSTGGKFLYATNLSRYMVSVELLKSYVENNY